MAQDFAKQRQPTGVRRKPVRAATRTAAPPKTSHWSWFCSGLMAGIIVSIAAYLGVRELEADAAEEAIAASDNPVELPQFNFGFYEELARAEVTIPGAPLAVTGTEAATAPAAATETPVATATAEAAAPANANVAATTATVATAEDKSPSYLLQAGSFQNRDDAEKQRARILLLNMNTAITQGVVSGRTFYRVQVGPFAGRQSAEDARNALAENSIESIPLLVR